VRRAWEGGTPSINLNGRALTIDSGGIEYATTLGGRIFGDGRLTSNQKFLDIRLTCRISWLREGEIDSIISDHSNSHKVGLRLTGGSEYAQAVVLSGTSSNTFSGDVEIWKNATLGLGKTKGAIAIHGNIFINKSAGLRFDGSGQVSKKTVIKINGGTISFGGSIDRIRNRFSRLTIGQSGFIDFGEAKYSERFISVDDLLISGNGELAIKNWKEGFSHLLVRRDSRNLRDAFDKITFEGYAPELKLLIGFDEDYWEVSALPEPTTYGAILATAACGLMLYRKRRGRAFLMSERAFL